MVSLCALGAWAGILPEFGSNGPPKKQPVESLTQRLQPQREGQSLAGPGDVAAGADSARGLSPREAAIAQQYAQWSNKSGGKFYDAVHKPLLDVLGNVLDDQLVDGADIVFLIDHTSSMEDDIAEIREQMRTLIDRVRAHKGVRVGMVTFSDVKSGSKFGYHAHGLTDDYDGLAAFLEGIELLGSVEDVYGAIIKTVEEFGWRSRSKRLIVIVSDEKPASGTDTNYTEDDVLVRCARHQVKTNLYPVLVDKYSPARQ